MYKILGGDGKEYGPVSAETLQQWINEGRANALTQVQAEGGMGWTALGQMPEFRHLFSAPAASFGTPVAAGTLGYGGLGQLPPPPPANNPLALTGFVLSLISITIGLCCCYGLPFNIAGIIFSAIGLAQIRKEPGRYSGRSLAIAGIVLGILSLLLAALFVVLGVALNWGDIQKEFKKM